VSVSSKKVSYRFGSCNLTQLLNEFEVILCRYIGRNVFREIPYRNIVNSQCLKQEFAPESELRQLGVNMHP
jgi:hypothetical protein